jgi:hypothetical protein
MTDDEEGFDGRLSSFVMRQKVHKPLVQKEEVDKQRLPLPRTGIQLLLHRPLKRVESRFNH